MTAIRIGEQGAVLVSDEKPGCNRIHTQFASVTMGEFDTHPSGIIIDRGFGHGIAQHSGDGLCGGHGGNIHDTATARFQHGRGKHLHRENASKQIQVEDLAQRVHISGEHILVRHDDRFLDIAAGSIHQAIHPPKCFERKREGRIERAAVEYIGHNSQGLASGCPHFGSPGFGNVAIASQEDHPPARSGYTIDKSFSQYTGRPGDDDGLTIESADIVPVHPLKIWRNT